jgi:hypothetical protein
VSVYTRSRGRLLVAAAGSNTAAGTPRPATFEATGLSCPTCYNILAEDLPAATWELARQHRMRRARTTYGRRRR